MRIDMSKKSALRLMQAALTMLAGDTKEAGQLLRGFTGFPGTLDQETAKYQNELKRITERWLSNAEGMDEYEVMIAMSVLIGQLQNAAERHIPKAYKLGLGDRPLTPEDHTIIQRALEDNLTFLQTSLAPAIEDRIEIGMDRTDILADAIRDSEKFSVHRAALYAGAFWTAVWLGKSSAIKRVFGEQALKEVPVRRLLDPGAKHCDTCPPKAREYTSWDEMIMVCSGLPADGSDRCHSNCRCTIQILDGKSWVYTI